MAINAIIQRMTADGLSATVEHPGGTWSHSPEYFKYRYGAKLTVKADTPDIPKDRSSKFNRLLQRLKGELTTTERTLLISQLETE